LISPSPKSVPYFSDKGGEISENVQYVI
jgi:hypothetical protein